MTYFAIVINDRVIHYKGRQRLCMNRLNVLFLTTCQAKSFVLFLTFVIYNDLPKTGKNTDINSLIPILKNRPREQSPKHLPTIPVANYNLLR